MVKNDFKERCQFVNLKTITEFKKVKTAIAISYLVINGGSFFGADMMTSGSVFFVVILGSEELFSVVDLTNFCSFKISTVFIVFYD